MTTNVSRERSLLLFRLSGLGCAFPVEAVQEIVPCAELSAPPGMPSLLAGFLDRSGTALPILRLDRIFLLPEQRRGLHTPFIVMRGGEPPLGYLVGAVCNIAVADTAAFLPLPENHLFRDCAEAMVEADGESYFLLSPERILLARERRIAGELQLAEQSRLALLEAV